MCAFGVPFPQTFEWVSVIEWECQRHMTELSQALIFKFPHARINIGRASVRDPKDLRLYCPAPCVVIYSCAMCVWNAALGLDLEPSDAATQGSTRSSSVPSLPCASCPHHQSIRREEEQPPRDQLFRLPCNCMGGWAELWLHPHNAPASIAEPLWREMLVGQEKGTGATHFAYGGRGPR